MAEATSIIAKAAEQSDSTAATAAADQYRAMSTETCSDPYDPEALNVIVAAHDFEAGGGKPQVCEVGVFQADVGFIDLAVITRNGVTQLMDIDCRHQLNCGPRLGMPVAPALSPRQLRRHHL